MTKLAAQRQSRSLLPELSELFTGFPAFAGLRPLFDSRLMRIEDEVKDGRYELRAELPGIDPANDVDITVRDGQLTIKAERVDKNESHGTLGVHLRLVHPFGVAARRRRRGRASRASYGTGILTISVPVPDAEPAEKHVEVQFTETDVEVEPAN